MINHNYVAEPGEYPTAMKTQGYTDPKRFADRYKKTLAERAEIYALKMSMETRLKQEFGSRWKQELRKLGSPIHDFDHSIVSNTKILAQWN
jgi:hypothetical protein